MQLLWEKNKSIIIGIAIVLIAFCIGRGTAPTKVETKIVTVEVEKKKTEQDTTIVEHTNKDGSKTKTTTIKTRTESEKKTNSDTKTVKETNRPDHNISVMAGLDLNNLATPYTFGIHVQKRLIGPINAGAFGFTNKTIGVSLGIQF